MSLKLMLTAAIGFLLTGCAVYGDTYDSRYRSYDRGYAQSYYYSPPPQRIYQPVYVVPRHDRYDDRRRYYDDRRRYGAHAYRPAPHRYAPAPHYQGGKRYDDRRHHNHGLRSNSALPLSISQGMEKCSCMISQRPSCWRRHWVTRIQLLCIWPLSSLPPQCSR